MLNLREVGMASRKGVFLQEKVGKNLSLIQIKITSNRTIVTFLIASKHSVELHKVKQITDYIK